MNLLLYIIILPGLVLADVFDMPKNDSDLVGSSYYITIQKDMSWSKLAIEHKISVKDLKKSNTLFAKNNWLKKGDEILINKEYVLPHKSIRKGIVINMAEQRLYFFSKNKVYSYPVAMGKNGWRTPTGITTIKNKTKHPTWHVPPSIREHSLDTHGYLLPDIVLPGPRNPLGTRAISLGFKGILIHGTNNKSSIGKLASSGCIRMHNEDVEDLFDMIDYNTPVSIVNHSIKIGKDINQNLVVEVHEDVLHDELTINEFNNSNLYDLLTDIEGNYLSNINWSKIQSILESKTGIPSIAS